MTGLVTRLSAHWQRIPAPRRVLLQASAWLLLALLAWLLLWQPGQQRLRLAEQGLAREQALARQLQQASAAPSAEAGQALTPARLSEGAQAAGLRVIELHARDDRLEVSLQGAADSLLHWLHGLEQGGARLTGLQLQARDQQLQARIGIELDTR